MKRYFIIILLFTCIIFNRCFPSFQIDFYDNVGKSPSLGQESNVDVGSTIYIEYDYQVYKTVKILKNVTHQVANIPKNSVLTGMAINNMTVYQPYKNYKIWGIILNDSDNDGKFDRIRNWLGTVSFWQDLNEPVEYIKIEGIPTESGGFKRELVYQGLSNNTIKVLYREYINDIARPAFSQIVEYDLDEFGKCTIVFKGARINVIEANSTSISYIVVQGFQD